MQTFRNRQIGLPLWEGAKAFLDSHRDKQTANPPPRTPPPTTRWKRTWWRSSKDIERRERQVIDAEPAKPTAAIDSEHALPTAPQTAGLLDDYRKRHVLTATSMFQLPPASNILA